MQNFLTGFAQEPIPTKVNIDTNRARQDLSNQYLISQIPLLDASEKNANYCYSYLSRKVCHNEAGTTLHLGDIVFPKQLDELYPMHTLTASTEGVGTDVAKVAYAKLLVG